MSQQRPQRRNYLPQKGAQSRFVVTLLLIIFLVSVITFCNLWVIGNWVVAAADLGTQIQFSDVFEKIRDLVWWRVGLIILVNLIIVGIIGIFYSHQFAGPSYKLEKCVREIAQGDLSFKIFLRTNDAMHNVADSLNRMIDNYRAVIAKAKELNLQCKDTMDRVKVEDDESEQALMALKGIQGELEDLLAGFKLKSSDAGGFTRVGPGDPAADD